MGLSDFVVNALNGRVRLWRVFWLAYVPLVAVLYFLAVSLAPSLLGGELQLVLAAAAFLALIYFLVFSLAWVAVWRCAWNVRRRFWGHLSRTIVVLHGLAYAFRVATLWRDWLS